REFPSITVKDVAASAIAHGADLAPGGIAAIGRPFPEGARVVLRSRSGALLAYGIALKASTEVRAKAPGWSVDCQRVFVDPSQYPKSWGGPTAAPTGTPPAES
ncbi:MAG TPA: PUA domain-containing protein, partial [Thermoplasmata archaeon]|nr:PUA domain-containing protein [Thermoplasmata archaeon]